MNTVSRAMMVVALMGALVAFGRVAGPDVSQAESSQNTPSLVTAAK